MLPWRPYRRIRVRDIVVGIAILRARCKYSLVCIRLMAANQAEFSVSANNMLLVLGKNLMITT